MIKNGKKSLELNLSKEVHFSTFEVGVGRRHLPTSLRDTDGGTRGPRSSESH